MAAQDALGSGRRLHNDKIFGEVKRFLDLHVATLEIAALLSVALAVLRRDKATLVIAALVVGWVIVEIAMVLHGWPGIGRRVGDPIGPPDRAVHAPARWVLDS